MKQAKLKDFQRGWFIGNFEPTLLKVKDFEVGIMSHKKGEFWPKHHHKISTEYNVVLKGRLTINGVLLKKNQIFVIEPGEITKAEFKTDCKVLVIKTPSVPGDKYIHDESDPRIGKL